MEIKGNQYLSLSNLLINGYLSSRFCTLLCSLVTHFICSVPSLLWGTLEPAEKVGSGRKSHTFAGFFVGAVFPGFERIFCYNLFII